jgi:hypothetical protein
LRRWNHDEGKQLQRRGRGGAGKCDGGDRQRAKSAGTARNQLECIQIEHLSSPVGSLLRQFGVLLGGSLRGKGFRSFASKHQNGFVGAENCFVAVLRQNSLSGCLPPAR